MDNPAPANSFSWKAQWPGRRIVTPKGLTLDLQNVHLAIFAETILYDIRFLNFDMANEVVVDIGAFVGNTALYCARQVACVYVYEPDPTNCRYLLTNMILNPNQVSQLLVETIQQTCRN